jgi:hypothetical protein
LFPKANIKGGARQLATERRIAPPLVMTAKKAPLPKNYQQDKISPLTSVNSLTVAFVEIQTARPASRQLRHCYRVNLTDN